MPAIDGQTFDWKAIPDGTCEALDGGGITRVTSVDRITAGGKIFISVRRERNLNRAIVWQNIAATASDAPLAEALAGGTRGA